MVLKQLQHFLSYLQQFERVFIRRQIDTTLAERRYELSAKQKQIEKDEKRMDELDRLFRKIYEDNVSGKLNDERFYKLSDGYEAEQGQLKREIEALTAEVSQADMEVTNVAKLIAVTKKYTRIDELTPEILNAFVDKIVIHEREKKDGKRTQQIDIYYSYVGIVDIPTDEEMREMEREYMRRTTRQTASIKAKAGVNLYSCRYISIFIPIWFNSFTRKLRCARTNPISLNSFSSSSSFL